MNFLYELLEMNLGRSQLEGSENPPLMPSECRDLGCPEGSQSKSSSSSYDSDMNLSEFLEAFPNPPQLMRSASETGHQWVFCSRSESNSSSVDVGAPMNTIHDKIISAFSNITFRWCKYLVQFWAPVTIDGRLLLSNSGQPFALTHLHKDLIKYLLDSDHKCKYNIDLNNICYIANSEDTQNVFGLRFTGYLLNEDEYGTLEIYNSLCDVIPRRCTEKHALKTLQDFKSRYISTLNDNVLLSSEELDFTASSLVICLRSSDTGDIDYAFEFIWRKRSNYVILLEGLLLTLKRCLPSFKFTSGAKLGDELDVIVVDCSEYNQTHTHGILPPYNEICNFKIFQGKPSSPIPKALEEGKKPTVVDHIAPSEKTTPEVLPPEDTEKQLEVIGVKSSTRGETSNIKVFQGKRLSPLCKSMEEGKKPLVKYKTAEILLTLKDIKKHFDKTMKEAAICLEVSESTLKHKLRKLGIEEWPRTKPLKRNKKDLSITQINTNEEVNGAIQELSTVTIKAEYEDRMIKWCLLISQATFETVVKEIGVKFKLNLGTYNLKYLDEDGDWISLRSDEDMSDCIKSSRTSDRILVRLRVKAST